MIFSQLCLLDSPAVAMMHKTKQNKATSNGAIFVALLGTKQTLLPGPCVVFQ